MKINLPENQHRNFVPFEGIAAFIDKPSERPAHLVNFDTEQIEEGAPISFTRAAVEAALPTLLGMGLCFQEGSYQNHPPRSKCGVITEAWIEGDQLRIRGGIYALDFPDVSAELQKNYRHLALCPLMRDLEIDPKTLPELFSVLKMTFTGVALMRVGTTGFDGTTIRIRRAELNAAA